MPKTYPLLAFCALLVAVHPASAASHLALTAKNPGGTARPAEVIVVPLSAVQRALGAQVQPDHLLVRDAGGAVVVSQITHYDSEKLNSPTVELIFQHDFAAQEKSARFTVEQSDAPVAPYPSKVFARPVPERFDDFAWENDRLGHRAYGPGLTVPAAGKDQMVGSGLDVWCKRVDYLIVDRWYLDGHYHKDTGEGLDLYDVGSSRGCGGSGVWQDGQLYPAGNYVASRVLANGPIRAVFELIFPLWDANGYQISEVKRFTVDAGKSLDRIDCRYAFASHAASGETHLQIALGLSKHDGKGLLTQNETGGWLSYWENYGKNGELGTGVLLAPGQEVSFAQDRLNNLLVTTLKPDRQLTYYAGAGWTRSPDFKSKDDWLNYLGAFASTLRAPIEVTYASP